MNSGLAFTASVYTIITIFLLFLGKPEMATLSCALGGSFIKDRSKTAYFIKILFFLAATVFIFWSLYSYFIKGAK